MRMSKHHRGFGEEPSTPFGQAGNAKKRAVNLTADAALLADAKALGLNLSEILDGALRAHLKQTREERWRAENRQAIEAHNDDIDRNGLWLDEFRTW
jgi:antitoxin CcdA